MFEAHATGTEHKSTILMHRQDKMLEFGAEKWLLQDQVRRWVAHAQNPWTLWWFWRENFYRLQERAAVYVLSSQGGVRMVPQEPCAQPEVAILYLGGSLSSHRGTQRYHYMHSLKRNQDPATWLHDSFLTAPPLLSHPLLSLISNYLNLYLWNSGKVEAEWSLFPINKKWRIQKGFELGRAPQSPAWCHHECALTTFMLLISTSSFYVLNCSRWKMNVKVIPGW